MNDLVDRLAQLSPAKREMLVRLLQGKSGNEPIAIVGMACRLPGATDLESYWRLITEGRSAVTEVPASRWDVDRFYSEVEAPGKMTTRWGAFVDDVDQFDPAFFGIAPREASRMDPQQRLLLEVAWEAIENALIPADQLAGEKVGVFVGIGGTDYSKIPSHYRNYLEQIDAHVGTGNALSIAANRLSYVLNLRGPSLAVDTACSSGLIATHLAIQSLRRGESDAALAGGVNLILSPETTIAFSKARMLSPDGVCRPFDAAANGYVRGEGCGVLLLKRLEDARRDGDPVLAVIRGSAANQDGRTSGITAPNGESQKLLIKAALDDAGLTLTDMTYLEAHGTGTPLGDPIEVRALAELFRREHEDQPLCRIASVKGNIGHTETVSGVAGLIKAVLMLQHRVIPPQANFQQINPHIDLTGARLEIPTEVSEWRPVSGTRVAGVSSYGFGGANVHVLLEEDSNAAHAPLPQLDRPLEVVALSARTPKALAELAEQYAQTAASLPDDQLPAFATAANRGRSRFAHRAAVIAGSSGELKTRLQSLATGQPGGGVFHGQVDGTKRPRVAMMFTGQGSQQPGMARDLYEAEPVFRQALNECSHHLAPHLAIPLLEVLYDDSLTEELNTTAYTQPALFAVQYALTALWKSWGVQADIVLGHSVGEYAAACEAGVMKLADAARLIAKRGSLIQALPRDGSMAAVPTNGEQLQRMLSEAEGDVDIAAFNGPTSTVISGSTTAVDSVLFALNQRGVVGKKLNVSHAFHSPLMESVLDPFQELAERIDYAKPTARFVSTLLGERIDNGELNASYWRRHIREAVRFEDGVRRLLEEEPDVVIEIGPAPQLLSMAKQFTAADGVQWLPSLRPGMRDHTVLFGSVAKLFAAGVDVDSSVGGVSPLSVSLPNYPFQKSRLWLDTDESQRGTPSAGGGLVTGQEVHPLLGCEAPIAGDESLFVAELGGEKTKYLREHVVQGSPVVPAAVYVEQALVVGARSFPDQAFQVSNLAIDQALFLPESTPALVQVRTTQQSGVVDLRVDSGWQDADTDKQGAGEWQWSRHAVAEIAVASESGKAPRFDLQQLLRECDDRQTSEDFYQLMDARGLSYGPAFRVLGDVCRAARHAVAEVNLTPQVQEQLKACQLPAVLGDACMQATAAVIPREPDGSYCPSTYMPTRVDRLQLYGDPGSATHLYVERTAPESDDLRPEAVTANVWLVDADGTTVGHFVGARMSRVDRGTGGGQDLDLAKASYAVSWESAPLAPAMDGSLGERGAEGSWLLVADEGGLAQELSGQLAARGGDCHRVCPTDLSAITSAISNHSDTLRGVIDLAAMDGSAGRVDVRHCERALSLTQALARVGRSNLPQLTWVTSGAQLAGDGDFVEPSAAALWGFGRVAANEHPELGCRLIDLQPSTDDSEGAVSVLFEVLTKNPEKQIVIREGARYAARLRTTDRLAKPDDENRPLLPISGSYRVELSKAGSFDGLMVKPLQRTPPPAGHVEVAVGATGLNFSDVLKALGLYPGIKDDLVPIGIECAGVVTAVGAGVDRLAVGDRVMGVAPYSFGSHCTTADHALAPTPANLSDEQAATLPIVALTAYHALVRLADLQAGERVLIHAGAGGVGLAAIQIAQHLKAEIFTTAGSEEKRQYLRDLGVERVYDSRSLQFAKQIRRDTQGEGVDVVLNSLPGAAIRESLRLLRAYGRFCEIGKTDIYADRALGLSPFQDNLSYFAIDLDRMLRQRASSIRGLFSDVIRLLDEGALRPLEHTRFSFADTRDAFRYMAQRKNIGKVVVSKAESRGPEPSSSKQDAFQGAWLVTGGLGALGLKVAEWLADRGVQRIGLLSRRSPRGDAAKRIERLRTRGVDVVALQGDVLELDSLHRAVSQLQATDVPLTGVLHAAGVLEDGVLYDMTQEQLHRVMAPKTTGAWNLHLATRDLPLAEFILFSSVACVLGSPGQANYSAGNAYLDGLAHWRRHQGLPARSINWGPWADGGMAAANDQEAIRGMELLAPDTALAALDRVLQTDTTQACVMLPRWDALLAGANHIPPLLSAMASDAMADESRSGVDQVLRESLLEATGDDRFAKLRTFFLDELAKIMGLASEELDPTQPLNSMGLDSLMAIELKNNVETRLGVVLPMARFMEGPSVADLAVQVAALLDETDEPSPAVPAAQQQAGRLPLSHGQQALWFLYQLAPRSTAYNIADAVRIRGSLDLSSLEKTIADLVARHGAFRTTFHADQGRPYQTVHDVRPTPLEIVPASGWTEEQIAQRIGEEVHRPFDLESGPLFRVVLLGVSENEHVLVFALHHIIADFWSLVACTDEFRQLYDHHANRQPLALQEKRYSYADFIHWQSDLLQSEHGDQHWNYWHEQLSGELPILELPTDRPRPPLQTFQGTLAFRWLDESLTGQLKSLAEQRGATLNMVLLAAYQLLLHRYSGQDDLVVGLPTSGRSRADFSSIVGYFVNPVAVRSRLDGNPSFEDYLQQVRQQTLGALEHQDYPFPMLVEKLHVQRDPSRSALFQALFVMQRAQVMHDQGLTPFLMGQSGASLELAGLTFESMTLEHWTAQFDVSLAASEAEGGVSLGLQYNTDLFDRETIESLLDSYQRLLRDAVASPSQPVGQLRLLSQADQTQLRTWNDTQRHPAESRPAHQRVAKQAAKAPDAVAVVSGTEQITYRELNAAANRLARHLVADGLSAGGRVGICLPRSIDLVVAMLATLKAGAAYVPLDPTYPKSRLDAILSAAGISQTVTWSNYSALLANASCPMLSLDEQRTTLASLSADDLDLWGNDEDLIYVIFTSGSTGVPKGAGVTHRGFANLLDWYQDELGLTANDRVLVVTSHGFDLTQKNFFATLAAGGQLHLSQSEVYDPEIVRREIADAGVTVLNGTPSNFYPLVDPRAADRFATLESLRIVVLGGEPVDTNRLQAWRSSGAPSAVINSYGPTECSDVVTRRWLTQEDFESDRPVSIGTPIGNVRAHLLDSRLAEVPIGSTGELCLSGHCLGAGYINDPELTKRRFVHLDTGEMVYRTGDLCRFRPDGQIEFVGRADDQVKIRGFRIELGDIEQALADHADVVEGAVVLDKQTEGPPRLLGYAVPRPEAGLAPGDLKAFLAERLPAHMVPANIVLLDGLPRTTHGKLDRRRLPRVHAAEQRPADFVPAEGEQERRLATVWGDVLHVSQVGRHDNFFDLGGDSLRSIEVVARLAAEGWRISPALMLQHQTIADLAPLVSLVSPLGEEKSPESSGPIPLTPIQRWFFELGLSHWRQFNQSVLMETPPGIDPDALCQACEALGKTHEALRLRFNCDQDLWQQEVTDRSRLIFLHEQLGEDPAQRFEQVQQSFSLEDGPLAAVLFLDGGADKPGNLLISLHHLVTDPYSTRLLLEDLQTAYVQASTGSPIALAPVATPLAGWTRALDCAAKHEETAAELSRWEAILDGASCELPNRTAGQNTVASAKTITFEVGEQQTRRLLDHAQQPSVLLLATLAETLQQGHAPQLVDVERLGRDTLPGSTADASRTIGWLVSMHPFKLATGATLSDTLGQAAETWAQIPRQGIGYGLLRYSQTTARQKFAGTAPAIRFNYLGSMHQARASIAQAFRPLDLPAGSGRNLEDLRTHEWEIDAAVRDGRLVVKWTYSQARHEPHFMHTLVDRFQQTLFAILEAK